MNELGMWIKQNTTRKEFAALTKTSEQSVARMCSRYGVPAKHIDMVNRITGIPMARLHGVASRSEKTQEGLTWGWAWVEKDLC